MTAPARIAVPTAKVLALMAERRSNKAIAQRLFVTEHTVEKHVKSILGTLRLPQSPVITAGAKPCSLTCIPGRA